MMTKGEGIEVSLSLVKVETTHMARRKQPKTFAFDHCFWSFNPADAHYSTQEKVFECLGSGVLENAFGGYNACIFAYGQTGSGKSYSMMGAGMQPDQKGVIPRLCDAMFNRLERETNESLMFKVEVSYMEIYNEKVRDLLDPHGSSKRNLKVREHKIFGPYVDGLSTLAVSSYEQIASLMEEGNKSRTVAATNMNSESSRSHAVFNIRLTQILIDLESGVSGEKVSKISLVDLAGSERVQKSGAVGKRLEEGANINKSLTTLGMVISALADQSSAIGDKSSKGRSKFVPYRDSVLTWLLKDNLGGNSKTVMIATVSPAADNYEETLSTLRYADRAKSIVNQPVVNEDPNARIIRELREEVESLRAMIQEQNQTEELRERLLESEVLMAQMQQTWEDRLKEAEQIHKARQEELTKMGICPVIKAETGKCYLVNLNADPSLNEVLVYYITKSAVIGSPSLADGADGEEMPDIVLQGLGVQRRHAVLELEGSRLFIEPSEGARTHVNGSLISSRTQLRNGYRLLIGNNHFFRVNCPKDTSMTASMSQSGFFDDSTLEPIDYEDALQEVLQSEQGENSIASAVEKFEKRYWEEMRERRLEDDKPAAVDGQREAYERYISMLKGVVSPMTPMGSCDPFSQWGGLQTPIGTPSGAFPPSDFSSRSRIVRDKFDDWSRKREDMFKESLQKLKKEIVKANTLVREANSYAAEIAPKPTNYSVTLQIPAANLRPSKVKKGAFVSEPAVLVKRKGQGSQVWSMDKLENKLIDMREMYLDRTIATPIASRDPFFESQENHTLIGVANVFLGVLFEDVRLDYNVPIISQQGEVAGRLHVEIYRLPDETSAATDSVESLNSDSVSSQPEMSPGYLGRTIKCRVKIKEASSLPPELSHFVFCQYSFFPHRLGEEVVAAPHFDANSAPVDKVYKAQAPSSCMFQFEHEKDFVVEVTEEFLEHVTEDALSIEVWGHRSSGYGSNGLPFELEMRQKSKSLQERWAEVTRRLAVSVEIHEMNDHGVYLPVDVHRSPDVNTGGVYQLRQGQQRRISVKVRPVADKGSLPLVCQRVLSIAMGCICTRNRNVQKPLDSWQDNDLREICDQWNMALQNRRDYLEQQINQLDKKPDKSELDVERENALISQWMKLTDERDAVCQPAINSSIPGAESDWVPPPGTERHIPVIYLNLNAQDMAGFGDENSITQAGFNSILPKEIASKTLLLPMLKRDDTDMSAECSWDSSIHEHPALNRVTPGHEHVYAVLKVAVRLSHPADMEIILRKRLCLNVYKKAGIAERLMKRIVGTDTISSTGVHYDLVAHIPKSSLDVEDRSTLALMAARSDEESNSSNESYIESYTKGISAVESILALDRLRQEVCIKEMLSRRQERVNRATGVASGFKMKRATSLPNAINAPLAAPSRQSLSIITDGSSEVPRRVPPTSISHPSMLTSLVSPASGGSKLAGIDEEQHKSDSEDVMKEPVRSATVPESLTLDVVASSPSADKDDSASSSGYGSQVLSSRSDDSVDAIPKEQRTSADEDDDVDELNSNLNSSITLLNESTYSDYEAKMVNGSIVSANGNASDDTLTCLDDLNERR
uniref:Kinesin-like protein unc-104 n=1 Tax=Plectus sambesii TaxID=2011161 RepID=A0A914XCF0_9BILA